MARDSWIRGGYISFSEFQIGRMLSKMKVLFFHHKYIAGHEVDFVIPRPGRRGLVVEVDGDMFHLDERRKAERDKVLKAAGWDVLHIWSSEVVQLPTAVQCNLEQALEGVPRIKKRKRRKSAR